MAGYSAVDLAILKATDRFAKIKDICISGIGGSANSFWKLRDDTAAVAYENRVDGTNTSKADTSISEMKLGKLLGVSQWFGNHNTYLNTDAGYSGGWTGYLDTTHARVSEYFNDVYNEVYGSRLAAKYVAAQAEKSANVLGTFAYTQTASASTDYATLDSTLGATRLGVVVTTTINDAGSDPLAFDVTVTNGIETSTWSISVPDTTAASSTPYTAIGYTGSNGANNTPSDITHGSSTVITLPQTTGFSVNGYALVVAGTLSGEGQTTLKEYVKVTAKTTSTLTVTKLAFRQSTEFNNDNLSSIRVYPCFTGVTAIIPTSATQPDIAGAVKIVPVNDRAATL
jgi:hypothetical protein